MLAWCSIHHGFCQSSRGSCLWERASTRNVSHLEGSFIR